MDRESLELSIFEAETHRAGLEDKSLGSIRSTWTMIEEYTQVVFSVLANPFVF